MAAEVADAWHDDRRRPRAESAGLDGVETLGAERGERLADRGEISGAVVDERDHNSPFVLGSIRANRLSCEQATRSARANALKTASILWWLERP